MKGLLFGLVLSACVAYIMAVECYTCGYVPGASIDESCNDPFNASSAQPTTSCSGQCIKTITTTNGDLTTLARSCTPSCPAGCTSVLGLEACIYCCDGDKCNGAGSVTFGIVTMGAAMLVGWFTAAW